MNPCACMYAECAQVGTCLAQNPSRRYDTGPLPVYWREPLGCQCHTCAPITLENMRMILCPKCGNKRCPHANDHRNECTNSNATGQAGSAYP